MPRSSRVRAHLYISGRVQGVYYRDSAKRQADALGVGGWVRNLADGRVELVAEGGRATVEQLIDWCRRGPDRATVTDVATSWEAPAGATTFEIRYS